MEFKHVRPNAMCPQYTTIAIDAPDTEELLNIIPYVLGNDVRVDVRMGIATCSKHDNFNKATGRHLAVQRFETGEDKTLNLEEYTFVKGYDYNILYTVFSYDKFMITFRSYLSPEYKKTDCHSITYVCKG